MGIPHNTAIQFVLKMLLTLADWYEPVLQYGATCCPCCVLCWWTLMIMAVAVAVAVVLAGGAV